MNLLAVIEYDGTDFLGFQAQKKGRTVQGELERALSEFNGNRIPLVGGGRTDTGVHALGQTATFKIEWSADLDTLLRALNAKLPRDIAVKSLRAVPENFSARKSARSRIYRYTVLNSASREPLTDRFAVWISHPLDVEAMQWAADLLVGRRDFSAFGTAPEGSANTIRNLLRAKVWRAADRVQFEFEADAFLYRMVRRMVGTLLQVGRGVLTVQDFSEVAAGQRKSANSAPPQGLTLIEVKY